jgi:hemerythrin
MTRLLTWQDSFVTHLPSVDSQHRRLLETINELGELVVSTTNVDLSRITTALAAIRDYVGTHFGDEEALMSKVGVDNRHAERHRGEHRKFVADLADLFSECREIELDRVRGLTEYLVHWFAYHILVVDQSMARQVRAIEKGLSPAAAYAADAQNANLCREPLLAAVNGLLRVVSERSRELRALNRDLEDRVASRTAELEEANRRLHRLATEDELTGLPNRRFAMMSLAHLWDERSRYRGTFSIMLLDLDRFKSVNDTFGHQQGDDVLRDLADRLRRLARRSDIVCRFGGDEFLVVCPHSDHVATANAARRILGASKPLHTSMGVACWDGGISIGIAETTRHMNRTEDLLAAADRALYRAKKSGGAQMVDASEGDQAGPLSL